MPSRLGLKGSSGSAGKDEKEMVVVESWFTRMPSFPWRISWCCCSNHIIIARGAFIQFNRPRLPAGRGARFSGGAGGLRRPVGRRRWRFLPPCCQARSRLSGAAVWWLMTEGWGRRGASIRLWARLRPKSSLRPAAQGAELGQRVRLLGRACEEMKRTNCLSGAGLIRCKEDKIA